MVRTRFPHNRVVVGEIYFFLRGTCFFYISAFLYSAVGDGFMNGRKSSIIKGTEI